MINLSFVYLPAIWNTLNNSIVNDYIIVYLPNIWNTLHNNI
jgi:hypothetical protein